MYPNWMGFGAGCLIPRLQQNVKVWDMAQRGDYHNLDNLGYFLTVSHLSFGLKEDDL
jgi:hypothetical protein